MNQFAVGMLSIGILMGIVAGIMIGAILTDRFSIFTVYENSTWCKTPSPTGMLPEYRRVEPADNSSRYCKTVPCQNATKCSWQKGSFGDYWEYCYTNAVACMECRNEIW